MFRGKCVQILCTTDISNEMFRYPVVSKRYQTQLKSKQMKMISKKLTNILLFAKICLASLCLKGWNMEIRCNSEIIKRIALYCHQQILSAKSDILKSMIEASWVVDLDVHKKRLSEILKFTYTKSFTTKISADLTVQSFMKSKKWKSLRFYFTKSNRNW